MTQKKILVVEDEEDIQELIRYNLVKEGYQAHCVGSGEAGLQEARKIFPDLLILDLMLPEMNGIGSMPPIKKRSQYSTYSHNNADCKGRRN